MIATIEISMYALTEEYAKKVINFIQEIKQNKEIRVEVNGLSTQLFGEYDTLIDILKLAMKNSFQDGKVVFLLKIAGSELTKENLPEILK